MSLPDVSRLEGRADLLRDLGALLRRLGVSLAAAAPVVSAAAAVPPAQRQPVRAFYLRRMRDPRGYAMRMFMFSDPVSEGEAREVAGALLDPLLDAGLLVRRAGGVVSPFILGVFDELYVLSDDLSQGSDAVMGFGETTITLCGAAFPLRPVGRVLDLGCGSGTAALLFAGRAREVVGTDINPRALSLARANAALNGVEGLSLLEGDLFAPVAGQSFDLVVSQPPFIARPEGVAEASFLYGGRRGDELALGLLRALVAHLTPGGRAVLYIDWPAPASAPLEERLRAALGPGANLLVLRAPPANLDAHAVAYAAGMHPDLGAAFEAEALLRREHFEREGIREIIPTMLLVERTTGAAGWTATMFTEPFSRVSLGAARVDKLFAARALADEPERLLGARLRVPEGTTLAQEQVGPGAEVPSILAARFAPHALMPQMFLNLESLLLVTCVHEAATVREGLARYAEVLDIPLERAEKEGFAGTRDALLQGLLEVA